MSRDSFAALDDAVEALRARADEIRDEGRLPVVKMLRDFEPSERVAARLEISTGGFFRRRDAGVDVMGDGTLVAFSGAVGRTAVEPRRGETVYDAVRRELS